MLLFSGVSYVSHRAGCAPEYTRVASFEDVEAVRTLRGDCENAQPAVCKGVLQLRVRAAQDTLALTCPTVQVRLHQGSLLPGHRSRQDQV